MLLIGCYLLFCRCQTFQYLNMSPICRYLWPLIHYHKFIAKCIKKLKRNGIDVKTSSSNVSKFLRQEVCNVSDHLAFMSKYDSEEWTTALRNFDGWTDHDPAVQEVMRNLVASQQVQSATEVSDVSSSLLRSQLDATVLKAMQAVKDEAAKAAERESYDYSSSSKGAFVKIVPKDVPYQDLSMNDDASQNVSVLSRLVKLDIDCLHLFLNSLLCTLLSLVFSQRDVSEPKLHPSRHIRQ